LETTGADAATAPKATRALLAVHETAILPRKSKKSVREYIKRGELPVVNASQDRTSKGKTFRPTYSVLDTNVCDYLKHLRA